MYGLSADPYSKTSASTALNQFRNLRTNYNGDLAHLAALGGNNLGGIAWVNALCTNFDYAYSNISSNYNNVPTYSWTVMVMTHEMGHNLGSNHTQWCGWSGGALDNCYTTEGGCAPGPAPVGGGTIMSYCHLTNYGINLNNGFGTQPGNKIRSRVSNVTCLSPGCTNGGGGEEETCDTPGGLSSTNITSTTATITWNAVSGATSYIFQYKLASSNIWSQTTLTGIVANFSSLSPSTTYNCRVQAVCPGGNSAFSVILTFTTLGNSTCNVPGGLSTSNITSNTAFVSWSAVSGAVSYNVQYKLASSGVWTELNTSGTNYTISSLLPITVYNWRVQAVCASGTSSFSTFLSFTTLSQATCNTPTGLQSSGITTTSVNLSWTSVVGATSYIVEYKLASSSIWSQQNANSNNTTISSLLPNSVYNWRVRTVCIANSSAFSATMNFTTLSAPSCNAPTGLSSSNITSSSANLSWSPVSGATSYIVEYKLSSSGTWSQQNTNTNSTSLTSLSPNSVYNWRVQTVCGANSSGSSEILNFTTLPVPGCDIPTGLNVSNITSTSANLSWSAVSGAISYIVEYKLASSGTWSQITASGNSTSLSSLLSNSTYNWRVKTVCIANSSEFSPNASFTTSGGGECNAPSNLNASNVTSSSASLTWAAVSGASSYNVEYKIASESSWTIVSATTNSINLSGLVPNSQYSWRVQSVCGGSSSVFSYQSSFRTSAGGGSCGIPIGLNASNITSTSATISWNSVSGAVSYNVEYKLASSGVWTLVNVNGTTTNLTSLVSNSVYNARVQAVCSGSSGSFSTILNFTTLNPGPGVTPREA
ncbi:MAG: fibronectin type III domain-containing protein [Saprospiraceae bacterium]|nr:fibronectin type III domain-containing protein [Saprospiraceae bacterium]